MTRFAQALGGAVERLQRKGDLRGTLGKVVSGRRLYETGRPGYQYVTLDNGTVVQAINHRISWSGGDAVHVILRTAPNGELKVVDLDEAKGLQPLGTAASAIDVPPHSHNIRNTALYDPVDPTRITAGLVRRRSSDAAMTVYVEPFTYAWGGVERYYPGGTLDLTSRKPVTSESWAWVKIGVNPWTNAAVAVTGAEYLQTTPIGIVELNAIAFAAYLPLAGVKLTDTTGSIPDFTTFLDCRPWVTGVRPLRKQWAVNSAAATFQSVGIAAVTVQGTPTNSNQTDSTYVDCDTGATTGNVAGIVSATFNLVRRSHHPIWTCQFRTGASLANLRIWAGLFSAAPTNVDALAGGDAAAFRYSTVAGDAGWIGVVRDGTAQAATAKIASIATGTAYLLQLRVDDTTGAVYFTVNNSAEVVAAANIPLAATDLGFDVYVFTTANVTKSIKISRVTCEHN